MKNDKYVIKILFSEPLTFFVTKSKLMSQVYILEFLLWTHCMLLCKSLNQHFVKGKGQEIKLPNLLDHRKSKRFPEKTSTSASFTMLKPLTVWITANCGKFFKRWEYQTTLPISQKTCIQVEKQQLEPDVEQLTGSKLGKEYVKAVCCHLACLTSVQSTSWETLGWMKHKMESRLPGEI